VPFQEVLHVENSICIVLLVSRHVVSMWLEARNVWSVVWDSGTVWRRHSMLLNDKDEDLKASNRPMLVCSSCILLVLAIALYFVLVL
jgi:hypothetical protein